jgi:small conductance mechanosensitive channel
MLRILSSVGIKMILVALGLLFFVNSLKINLTAALTGAGVVGVALGLATQELLRDFVTGFFIVLEDQFAVGDVICTSNMTGTVEEFTFRITRLRDMEGKLITIPNSTIRLVENLSSGWSQVDCSVMVSYGTDLAKAMNILLKTAQTLKEEWPDVLYDDPQVLGVEELGESGIRLRMIVKTAPLEQWRIRRELLLRIKNGFDAHGIEIPFPQRVLWMRTIEGSEKEEASHGPAHTIPPPQEAGPDPVHTIGEKNCHAMVHPLCGKHCLYCIQPPVYHFPLQLFSIQPLVYGQGEDRPMHPLRPPRAAAL